VSPKKSVLGSKNFPDIALDVFQKSKSGDVSPTLGKTKSWQRKRDLGMKVLMKMQKRKSDPTIQRNDQGISMEVPYLLLMSECIVGVVTFVN
jgi:hypothetical protein